MDFYKGLAFPLSKQMDAESTHERPQLQITINRNNVKNSSPQFPAIPPL